MTRKFLTLLPSQIIRLWLLGLLSLMVTGTAFVPEAAAQTDSTPRLTIVAPALYLRSGPDLSYPPFDTLLQGTTLGIIGYEAESDWWQVVSRFGSPGWVSGGEAYVSVNEAAIQQFVAPQAQTITPAMVAPSAVGVVVFQTSSGGPIYAINADGTNLRYLTTGLDPALSPDGQRVAFTRWETSQDGALGNLWLINVDGTGERVIHENVFNPRTPVWSADGSQVVITMQHGGRVQPLRKCWGSRPPPGAYDVTIHRQGRGDVEFCFTLPPDPFWGLRLVNLATGTYEDLPNQRYSFSPAWDPANAWRLVYDGNLGLVNLDLTRSENESWPLTDDFNDHSPVFSPDGSKIAVSYRQDDHWEIQVLNADGSGRVRLTKTAYQVLVAQELNGQMPHSWNNASPAWSPDGSQIAFLTDRTGQWQIWVMNADGSDQRPLFPPETLAGLTLQYNGVDERALSWR